MGTSARFPLGEVLITTGALELCNRRKVIPYTLLTRHVAGDWGDVCDQDRHANEEALASGARLFSVYRLSPSEKLWIITEADRSVTTLLLPEDY